MKKNILTVLLCVLFLAFNAPGQDKEDEKKEMPKTDKEENYKAAPGDVASIDAIIKATYDVISGGKDEKRDWQRFRSLFHPSARLIPTGKSPADTKPGARAYTPGEYIKRSEPFMMQNGFFEREVARRTEVFGGIAHVFSTYEGRYKLSDEKPFLRGINSFQLFNDGERWWVVTIFWQAETPDTPLPANYLQND